MLFVLYWLSDSGPIQPGGLVSSSNAPNTLNILFDPLTGLTRQFVPSLFCAFYESFLFFASTFFGSSKQLSGTCVVDVPHVMKSCLFTKLPSVVRGVECDGACNASGVLHAASGGHRGRRVWTVVETLWGLHAHY